MGNDLNNLLALVRAAEAIATALNNYGIGEREFADMREAAFEQGRFIPTHVGNTEAHPHIST